MEEYFILSTILSGKILIILYVISLFVNIFSIIVNWILFNKAGKKGWESIIPIYNNVVLLEIVELPLWYIILYFIPITNIYLIFKLNISLAHKFGKSTGFGIGLVFLNPIFTAILAFSDSVEYKRNYSESKKDSQPSEENSINNECINEVYKKENIKFCINCGFKVNITDKFCTNCGNRL